MSISAPTNSWPVSTIAQHFQVQLGKRFDAAVNKGELKLCMTNRGVRWGRIDPAETVLAPLTRRDIDDLRLDAGDVLVCEGGEIGRASVWRNELRECYYQNTLHRLRSTTGYEPHLIVALLEYWGASGALTALVGKSSLAHLTKENLLRVPIPVPPPSEQKAIASAIVDADELIATLERMIAKKQAIKQGMMQQLLTGRTRLPGFAVQWFHVEVGGLLDFKNGLNKGSEYFGWGTPIVNFMDVMNGPIITAQDVVGRVSLTRDEIKRFSARRGDLFFTRTSETVEEVGTAAVLVDDIADASFSGFLLRGRPKAPDLDSRFLAHLFSLDVVRSQVISSATYTTRALTNGRSLSRVSVVIPGVEEQRVLANRIADADAALAVLRARLVKARDVKTGMMQQLLTGGTRLPPEAKS